MKYLARHIDETIRTILADTRVLLISGPRQAGKTTLARSLAGSDWEFRSLDNSTTLASAQTDPIGFIRQLDRAVIDEVQRVPELLLAIKQSVDEDPRPGRFILTGSANIMTLPRIADSLAGRMEIVRLLPLSRSGLIKHRPTFLEGLFSQTMPAPIEKLSPRDMVSLVLKGGFPEALSRSTERRRHAWLRSYSDAIIQRDVRDVASVSRLDEMPRLLRVLAEHSGQLANFSELGGKVGFDHKTTQRYVGILESVFVVTRLEPWYTSKLARITKSPKFHFVDSGLLAAMRGLTEKHIASNRQQFGAILETFVVAEIMKQISWADERFNVMHFRDREKDEVDIVVENESGDIVGIEVKAAATVSPNDFKGLKVLQSVLGKKFLAGVLLCASDDILPFGNDMWALPLPCLWS